MGQTKEETIDAQTIAKNLIDTIVAEVMKTINKRTDTKFDSFENLKVVSFGNEEILTCVKSERTCFEEIKGQEPQNGNVSDACYQNLPEVCIHSSTLSTQGEGDQPPTIREAAAFYYLRSESLCHNNQTCKDSSHSSINTAITDELIAQLHGDINNLSFDDIHLSDSETENATLERTRNGESECSSLEEEEVSTHINRDYQTNSSHHSFEKDNENTSEPNDHKLKHSPKFCQLNDRFIHPPYFILKENCDEKENEEELELLSTSSDELMSVKTEKENCVERFSTNPFRNPFLCSDVQSTIALSSNTFENRDFAGTSNRTNNFFDVEKNGGNDEWEEANEIQIRTTEPGCSKDILNAENLDTDVIQTRQYWSNVGLMTERSINPKYLGPVEIPGIESIQGITRVEEKVLIREPEEIMWVTEAEPLDKGRLTKSSQHILKDDDESYLSLPDKKEEKKKKKNLVSRLTKTISSIFKFKNKNVKE